MSTHDLPRKMSRFLAAGIAELDVLAAVTNRPAGILNLRGEGATLKPGSYTDLKYFSQSRQLVHMLTVAVSAILDLSRKASTPYAQPNEFRRDVSQCLDSGRLKAGQLMDD